MTRLYGYLLVLALVACGPASALGDGGAGNIDPFAPAPTWKRPTIEEVRAQVRTWLDEQKVDAAVRAKVESLWNNLPAEAAGTEVLETLAAGFGLVEPRAAELVARCSQPRAPGLALAPPDWLADKNAPALVRNNLRLFYGRWLVQERLYDDALEQLGGLEPGDVVDPASLLFYQGVVYHRLLNRDEALARIESLLAAGPNLPDRYKILAQMMRDDFKGLEDESLDHISRRMQDIERRLDLGHAGPKVRQVEDGVIASLDKLIKKIEDQQQQQDSAAGASNQSTQPASESRPMGGRGPGEVDKKNVGSKSGWGNLPPKQRQEALQQIGKEFPSHYRDVIEQYFRKLATEGENPGE